MSQIKAELAKALPLIASGKVRELYEVDADTLLFVASDRISAYDVIMDNVSFLINLCNHQRHSLKL
jgi:phosphoribosylaminoimidazole-succinocarboxamide synthase